MAVVMQTVDPREAAARQSASLSVTAHRPWPLPRGPWIVGQTWTELLFAHWRLPPSRLAPLLPYGLELDTFEGWGWLAVTPLRMSAVRIRGLPFCPPGLTSFLELNVRTCVRLGDRPGVYFFSLDASSRLAVGAARWMYRLPYFTAWMSATLRKDAIELVSHRRDRRGRAADLTIRYRATGAPFVSAPGTLEHFLTERYRLYTSDGRGRLFHADIHHAPWSLREAEARIERNTMAPSGIDLGPAPDLLHCGARQDVVAWPLERIG